MVDITKSSVMELKALVYDELARVEMAQANMKTLNQEIARRSAENPPAIAKKTEEKEGV